MIEKSAWVLVLSLTLAAPAAAGEGVWTPIGGPEPPTSRVLVDPTQPETVYALVSQPIPEGTSVFWKSTDGGETWESIHGGIGAPVDQLVIDPLRHGRLYAWRSADFDLDLQLELWVSEDGGESWTVAFVLSPAESFRRFWQIVASPVQEGVLFAWASSSSNVAVYRSTDGGATWNRRGEVRGSSSVEALSVNRNRKWLEYFNGEGFYVSADDGLTWSVRGTFSGAGFQSVVRSDAAPDRLYARPLLGNACLVRSDDGGATWRSLRATALPDNVSCFSVAVDPRDPDLVRVVSVGQAGRQYVRLLSTSRNGGATWSRPRPIPVNVVVPTAANPATLFGDSYYGSQSPGLFRSTDGGETWLPSSDGIANGDLRAGVVAFPGTGNAPTLVAGGDGVKRSVDGGRSWATIGPRGAIYSDLIPDAGGELLYALRFPDHRVVTSTDRGQTWMQAPKPRASLNHLIADPYRPGRVFSIVYDSRTSIWRTLDAAATWARRSNGLPVKCAHIASVDYCPDLSALTSDPQNTERVLLAFGGSYPTLTTDPFSEVPVFVSNDRGTSWRLAAQSPPGAVFSLAADPGVAGAFLAGTYTGRIYRSADGGEHWTALGSGLPVEAPLIQLLHDDRSGAWYAVTHGKGVFRSTDGGRSWSLTGPGLPDLASPRALLDPKLTDRLLLATRSQGLWSWSAPAQP
jgi:photosystem II stability/assembly factor-like uncharacterized protein